MKPPIFVRELSENEREGLQAGVRSKDAFVMRRAQILLASARGLSPPKIAENLGCASQTVRNAIRTFNEKGLDALVEGSSTPKRVDAAFEAGLTQRRVSGETIRAALSRLLGIRWMRAKRWITSPDPLYERKKASFASDRLMEVADGDPEWAIGFQDECWWSRVALPTLSAFSEEGDPRRMIQRSVAKDDPEPKAVSCYGLYLPRETLDDIWLRFVDGRPVSSITTQFLSWCLEELEKLGKKVLLLIWDNASWHISKLVRRWLGRHNRKVKNSGEGVRIVSCLLPKQSPWLNAIEPKWVHGKRRVVEFDGLLGAYELAERVCGAFGCPHHGHLSVPQEVA